MAPYSGVVGNTYVVLKPVEVVRIRADSGDPSQAFLEVIPPPGISGPEVSPMGFLPPGTTFTVRAAKRAAGVPWEDDFYEVETHAGALRGQRLRVFLARGNESGDHALNPIFYQRTAGR